MRLKHRNPTSRVSWLWNEVEYEEMRSGMRKGIRAITLLREGKTKTGVRPKHRYPNAAVSN